MLLLVGMGIYFSLSHSSIHYKYLLLNVNIFIRVSFLSSQGEIKLQNCIHNTNFLMSLGGDGVKT